MEAAKDYGMSISIVGEVAGFMHRFEAPRATTRTIFSATRLGDQAVVKKSLQLSKDLDLYIYALGEGRDRDEMFDYGWIENVNTGETVWEMTYRMTSPAGGGKKNRMVNTSFLLNKGEYELHYLTGDSHAFNDWNTDPPEDRTHWGITLYQAK